MSRITTHILDTSRGCPAEGVKVVLCRMKVDDWEVVTEGQTNGDGRILDWAAAVSSGVYMLRFETMDYFDRRGIPSFYPFVEVHFEITTDGHYHIPLLLNPYGYSTYRGS
jgi:5-hydroxyisourate hydrolase